MASTSTKVSNIFDQLPQSALSGELFETILEGKHCRLERIVSTGQTTPDGEWYDQEQDEWVIVLQGTAKLVFEPDHVIELQAGDYINIPAHQRHRVSWTDPNQVTVWLALHVMPDQ